VRQPAQKSQPVSATPVEKMEARNRAGFGRPNAATGCRSRREAQAECGPAGNLSWVHETTWKARSEARGETDSAWLATLVSARNAVYDRIKVPACGLCNNKKSELEHYLTAVLPSGVAIGRKTEISLHMSDVWVCPNDTDARLTAKVTSIVSQPAKGLIDQLIDILIGKGSRSEQQSVVNCTKQCIYNELCVGIRPQLPGPFAPFHRGDSILASRMNVLFIEFLQYRVLALTFGNQVGKILPRGPLNATISRRKRCLRFSSALDASTASG